MPSTIGACGVEKQEWFCRIKKISCEYVSRGRKKTAVLYQCKGPNKEKMAPIRSETEPSVGFLAGEVSNNFGRYYVIANNDGVNEKSHVIQMLILVMKRIIRELKFAHQTFPQILRL